VTNLQWINHTRPINLDKKNSINSIGNKVPCFYVQNQLTELEDGNALASKPFHISILEAATEK
jgi:hypothetical protein